MNKENSVLHTAEQAIAEHGMISRGDTVLAAVSGGADSVCMLHVLKCLAEKLGFRLCCAHLNHGLRGEAADGDERIVEELCRRLKVRLYSKKLDVGALAAEKKITVEEAGRNARYAFFDELCAEHKINKVATAHNKNDNAETVLMRILRGTGTDGLRGIPHVREERIIRPLLDVERAEIEKYCAENGLDFRTDATNFENDYTRNKIRNELIPYLEKNFGNVVSALTRLADNAGDDADFLNEYTERLYANPLPDKKCVTLHAESLKMIKKPIAVRVIRLAASRAAEGVRLERRHTDSILELLTEQTGAAVDLPNGLRVEMQYGWLVFEDKNKADKQQLALSADDGFFAEIKVGGSYYIDALGKSISFKLEDARQYKPRICETMLDYDMLEGKRLFLRSRRGGDRIVWFSDGRTKKIKNILIDAKIPKRDRDKIPLLCTGDEVAAIAGFRVSEKYRIKKATERALVIVYGTGEEHTDAD